MTLMLVEHLASLCDTASDMALVRSLFLDLAVAGKLCARLDTEESPIAWQQARLGDVVGTSGAGWSPACETRPRRGDEWGVLKVSAVSWSVFKPEENKALPASLKPRPDLEVQPGDFLVSRANTADLVARSVVVESTPPKLMLSDKIVRLRLKPSCNARFIQFANSSTAARAYYAAAAGGTSSSMKNVSRAQILGLPISLPPLAEQHRIVAKVDELMALCDRLQARQQDADAAHAQLVQALLDSLTHARDADDFRASWQRLARAFDTIFTKSTNVDALRKAVLQLAAEGKLVSAESTAQQLPVGSVLIGDTLNGCSRKPSDEPSGTPILRISAGTGSDDFYVDEADHKWIDLTGAEREKFRLLPNDLLACRFNGNLHFVGSFSLYRGALDKEQVFPDKLIRFRADPALALPNYLRFVMNAAPARRQIEAFCATTVGNIGISASNLKTVQLRVPPLAEQHRIVAKVTELLTLCDQLKARIAAARAKHAELADALIYHATMVKAEG